MPESSERSWVRSGVVAALLGMACWIIGLALIPVDAQLQNGEEQLADLLRSDATRLYLAMMDYYNWANNPGVRNIQINRPGQIITVK